MKKSCKNICLILAIILCFLYNMKNNVLYFAGGTIFALPGIYGLFNSKAGDLQRFTIVAFLGSVLDMLSTSYQIGGTIVFFVVCGITFSCLKNLKLFFTITFIICIWLISFLYYSLFENGIVAGDIFIQYGLSKNYPASMLVIFNCLWAIWKYLYYHKMPLILPILSTVMAFFLDGRSSLICMILITVFCFIFRGKGLTMLMLCTFVALIVHFRSELITYYEFTSIASKGFETPRYDIWKSYLNNLNLSSVFLGLDTQNLPILKDYGGNPHNSFLSFHRRMGFIGVSILLYYIFVGFKFLIRTKWFVVLFFECVLLLRMFFDGMLVTAEDFFIYTILFIPVCYGNKTFNIEKQLSSHRGSLWERSLDKILILI